MANKNDWKSRLEEWGFTPKESPLFPFEIILQEDSENTSDEDDKLCLVVDMSRQGAICLRTGFGDSVELGGIETKEELQTIIKCVTGSFPNW